MTVNGRMQSFSNPRSLINKETNISASDSANLFQICNPRLVAQNRHSCRLTSILHLVFLALLYGFRALKHTKGVLGRAYWVQCSTEANL